MTVDRADRAAIAYAEDDLTARAIAEMVAGTERINGFVVMGVMAVCVGVPLLIGLAYGQPLLGLANALLLGFVGWGLALLAHRLILRPVSVIRYSRAATRLGKQLQDEVDAFALHRSWSEGTPGAITVARDGRVWLADRSTQYRSVALERSDIVYAEAISHYLVTRSWRPWAALGIGVPLGGRLFATFVPAARRKPADMHATHALIVHYASRDDPTIRATSIPFGANLDGARSMATVLDAPRR